MKKLIFLFSISILSAAEPLRVLDTVDETKSIIWNPATNAISYNVWLAQTNSAIFVKQTNIVGTNWAGSLTKAWGWRVMYITSVGLDSESDPSEKVLVNFRAYALKAPSNIQVATNVMTIR